jgi:tripartite-type tricarboxylate transporter receptor subunit TctC
LAPGGAAPLRGAGRLLWKIHRRERRGRYVAAANSPGDGHTLLFVTNDFAVAPTVSSKVNYDAIKSFAPVTITAASPQVVVVHPSFPAKNMQELITLATANPGKYNYASLGIGFGQLSSERLFRLGLGLDVVRVPFPGAAPIITSTLAGHTPIAMLGLPPAAPHIKRQAARARRNHQRQALAGVSDVPPGESRVRDQVRADHRRGRPRRPRSPCRPLAAPDRAHRRAARRAAKLDALGFRRSRTPEAYAVQIKGDIETWSKVVRDANIKVD